MPNRMVIVLAGFALVLAGAPAAGHAQGKGGDKGHGGAVAPQGGQQGGGRGQAEARPSTGQQGRGRAEARPSGGQQGGGRVEAQARPRAPQGRGEAQAQARPAGGQQGRGNARAERGGRVEPQGRGNAARPGATARERGPGNASKAGNGRGATASRGAEVRASHAPAWAKARQELDRLPQHFRALERSERRSDRLVLGATALAAVRGLNPDALELRREADRVQVRNRRGELLLDLDDAAARDLGSWDLRLLGDRLPSDDAPAFCRSGAGHPVWGRQWCLDRGYGLGRTNGRLWSRTSNVTDIIFRQPSTLYEYRYDRPSLLQLLGSVVLDRLALQALSLGFDQPLVGRWVAQPQAPRLLLIDAGPQPVAELVDLNGDNRVDVLYVESGW